MKFHIPYDDFGGRGELLHFAHANAYPPGAYHTFLSLLASDYHVQAIQHRPLWPGSRPQDMSSWREIADDLIRFFDQQGMRGVVGVGHSLGAVATMMASLERPDLFRALILIEPVFLPPDVLDLLAASAALEEPYESPLVTIARKRSNYWPTRQDAFDNFRAKEVFARWSEEVLWDYVRWGLSENGEGGFNLAYSPEWEARIYSLPPTDIWALVPSIMHPTLGVRGGESNTLTERAWLLWQQMQPEGRYKEYPDIGHLLPMEQPEALATEIRNFIAGLSGG